MGNKAYELIQQGKTVLFAFEEAIGYMPSSLPLDKDGVQACCKMAELAVYLDSQGKTLTQQLNEIYKMQVLFLEIKYLLLHFWISPIVPSMIDLINMSFHDTNNLGGLENCP